MEILRTNKKITFTFVGIATESQLLSIDWAAAKANCKFKKSDPLTHIEVTGNSDELELFIQLYNS